jgi:hypothetical protein
MYKTFVLNLPAVLEWALTGVPDIQRTVSTRYGIGTARNLCPGLVMKVEQQTGG